MYTKCGFSLLELILALALSATLIGGLIILFQSTIKEIFPKAIEYEGRIYAMAPSSAASVAAFDFHHSLLHYLKNVETCLCFGGNPDIIDGKNHTSPINSNFNYVQFFSYDPLIKGEILNIRDLVRGLEGRIETYFEQNATKFDLTCVLLNRNSKKSIFVQLRSTQYWMNYDAYQLYSVDMYLVEGPKKIKSYSFAVKASEDSYSQCDVIKKFFYGNNENRREGFDIIAFPDPYLVANNSKSNLKSLSRFIYILDGF